MEQRVAGSFAVLVVMALTLSGCGKSSPAPPPPPIVPPAHPTCVSNGFASGALPASWTFGQQRMINLTQEKIAVSISWDSESPSSSCCNVLQSFPTGGNFNSSWQKAFCSECGQSENFAVKVIHSTCKKGAEPHSSSLSTISIPQITQLSDGKMLQSTGLAEATFLANRLRDSQTCYIVQPSVKLVRYWRCNETFVGPHSVVLKEITQVLLPGMKQNYSIPDVSSACCSATNVLMHSQWTCEGDCCGPSKPEWSTWCSACAGNPAFDFSLCSNLTRVPDSTAIV